MGTVHTAVRVRVRTGSRLHFGLLAMHPDLPRRFGGVGLMVDAPGSELTLEPAEPVKPRGRTRAFEPTLEHVRGPHAARVAEFAGRFCAALEPGLRSAAPPFRIRVQRAAPEHAGLGTGTQLGLATAAAVAAHCGAGDLSAVELAERVGRGLRSAVGLHGFEHGGLLVEGGKRPERDISPLIARVEFPSEWRIVLAIPEALRGLHGGAEVKAFADLPAVPLETTRRLCEITLLRLLPAAVEAQSDEFGDALYELQQLVGSYFQPAQGGVYADRRLEEMVKFLRGAGVRGVGQSSWGPALYAVTADEATANSVAGELRRKFNLSGEEVLVTAARNRGADVVRE